MTFPATGTSKRQSCWKAGGVLLGVLILLAHARIAHAQTKTWFGGYGALWSDPANWVGGVAPVDGDSLEFPYEGTWSHNMWNDIPGLTLNSVTSANDFRVGGETVTLTGSLTFGTWDVPTILGADVSMKGNVSKPIELAGHALTLDGGLGGPIQGAGSVTVSSGLIVGETSVSAFAGTLTVAPGAGLTVYGMISGAAVVVGAGGFLGGSGTVGTTTLTGATLTGGSTFLGGAPFVTGDLLVQGGRMPYQFWLSPSITAQTELVVHGTVTIANPALELSMAWNPPVVGQQFVLIDNDASDPVSGTFAGLPEGAIFEAGETSFRVNYAGGDGNDVVLTALAWHGPKRWVGGVGGLWSDPANWLHGVPPIDGDSLYFPYYGAFSHNMWNDIPGLTLHSVESVADFQVGGETVTLTGSASFQKWNVPTVLGGPASILADVGNVIELNGQALTLGGSLSGSIQGAGSVTVSSLLSLGGLSQFAGTFTVLPQAYLRVSGTISGPPLTVTGGTLSGSGTVPATTVTNGALELLSGQILTTGDLRVQSGRVHADLYPLQSDVSRVRVLGSVALENPALEVFTQTSPTPGQSFLLVDNDGADPISGTFAGLPEGAFLPYVPFRITYLGGTGNDVVITGLTLTWTTLISSPNPANVGQPITLTANVASASVQPSGSVVFEEWAYPTRVLGTAPLDANGRAAIAVQLAPGPHWIVARYSGGGAFGSSVSDAIQQVVNGAPSGTAAIPTLGGTALCLLAIGLAAVGARLALR